MHFCFLSFEKLRFIHLFFLFLFEESFIKFQIFLRFRIHLLSKIKKQINEFMYLYIYAFRLLR